MKGITLVDLLAYTYTTTLRVTRRSGDGRFPAAGSTSTAPAPRSRPGAPYTTHMSQACCGTVPPVSRLKPSLPAPTPSARS